MKINHTDISFIFAAAVSSNKYDKTASKFI